MFGSKQCSAFEELCTGTAEEVLYSLCFRSEGSGQNNAAVSKDRKAIQIYAQLQPGKYCINCVLEMKAQVRSSAAVSKKR